MAPEPRVILVDTAAWADFFNGVDTPHVRRLRAALDAEEDLAIGPIIVTEVLQGLRTDKGFATAQAILIALPCLQLDMQGHVRAAQLFRRLRKRGVTVRGAVDCIIAQTCIEAGADLLSPDRDFAAIATHAPLQLCAV